MSESTASLSGVPVGFKPGLDEGSERSVGIVVFIFHANVF
jgi:hypothetical protein